MDFEGRGGGKEGRLMNGEGEGRGEEVGAATQWLLHDLGAPLLYGGEEGRDAMMSQGGWGICTLGSHNANTQVRSCSRHVSLESPQGHKAHQGRGLGHVPVGRLGRISSAALPLCCPAPCCPAPFCSCSFLLTPSLPFHVSQERMSIHVKIRGMPEDASKHVTHPIKSTARLRFDKTWVWGKWGRGGWCEYTCVAMHECAVIWGSQGYGKVWG